MATNLANSFCGAFGSYLGSKIVAPETPQAALFASAGSARLPGRRYSRLSHSSAPC